MLKNAIVLNRICFPIFREFRTRGRIINRHIIRHIQRQHILGINRTQYIKHGAKMKTDINQLEFIDRKLRDMAIWIEEKTGLEFTITSLYRIDDNGVHGTLPLRGLDFRCRNLETGITIEALINTFWIYDRNRPGKKCCFLHGHDSNLHFHFQVHPNTEFMG